MAFLVNFGGSNKKSSGTLEDSSFWDLVENANSHEERMALLSKANAHFAELGLGDSISLDMGMKSRPKL